MKAYKGFDKDLKCMEFQYEIGNEYETDKAVLCVTGFHACENPLDTFRYYAPGSSRFCEVELEDVSDEMDSDDSKRVAKKIKIGAELDIKGLIKAIFEYVKERCTNNEIGGYRSALNGGDSSALNGGDWSALNGGDGSALNGGDRSVLRGGEASKFKGGKLSVFACEFRKSGKIVDMKTAIVDGVTIKENTWYTVENGEWVEVE